jgi:uncharacterized protein (DUF1810 family)
LGCSSFSILSTLYSKVIGNLIPNCLEKVFQVVWNSTSKIFGKITPNNMDFLITKLSSIHQRRVLITIKETYIFYF